MAKIKAQFEKPKLELYTINKQKICDLTTANYKTSAFSIKKVITLNDINTLNFSLPYDSNEYIDLNSCEYLVKHEFDYYIIKNVSLSSSGTRVLEVSCESEFTVSKTILCTAIESIGVTPLEMFNAIVTSIVDAPLGYRFLGTDVDYNRSLIVEDEKSVFENLIEMAKVFNATIEFSTDRDGNKGVYLRKNPHERGKYVRRGKDLKQLNINYDSSSLFTRLQPFGGVDEETGQEINIMGVNPTGKSYIENYSYYINKGLTMDEIKSNPQCMALSVRRFSDIVDENYLMIVAQEELDKISKPRITGSLSYVDLGVLEDSSSLYPIIYEKIIIADKDINMVFSSNIVKIEIDYDKILESKITMDNLVEYKSIFKELVTNAEKVDKITGTDPVTGKPTLIGSVIQGQIDTAKTSIGQMLDSIEQPQNSYAIMFENRILGHELFGA